MAYAYVLFPGRHHLLTRFQAAYLERAVAVGVPDTTGAHADTRGAQIVFAVTSADHGTTRRNPLPAHRREAQIERYAALSAMACLVYPVDDVPQNDRFAAYLLAAIAVQEGPELTPENTVVACSTPAVIALFEALGFRILPVELDQDVQRPWDVLETLVAGQETRAMHPASAQLWERYGLLQQVRRAHADPLLTDEGELTETRDYNTYARAFDTGAARKWSQLRDVVKPGRIVDVGCGVGSLLHEAAKDPAFAESDLYGIEAARPLFDECVHRRGQGAFANPNTFFFQRTIGTGPLFAPASVDTTLTVALCHELYSYLGEPTLRAFMAATREHTVPGGRWIDLDVCGPEDGDRIIWLELHEQRDSWERFVADWLPERIEYALHEERYVETRLRWAMEWLSKKDYTDNWESEMHEAFCFWGYSDWERAAREAGFEIAPGSHGFTNPWLVEHRFAPVATLRPAGEREAVLPWPDTHLRLVARRPAA